jgi:hypothetical protein
MQRWVRSALGFLSVFLMLAALGSLGAVIFSLRSGRYREEALWLVPLGALVLGGAVLLARFLRTARIPAAAGALTVTLGATYLYASLVLFPLADRYKSPAPFCRQVQAVVGPGEELRSFGLWRWDAAYIYYTRRLMPVLHTREELDAYLAQDHKVFLIVESSEMDPFLAGLGSSARVILRQEIGGKTTALLTNGTDPPS